MNILSIRFALQCTKIPVLGHSTKSPKIGSFPTIAQLLFDYDSCVSTFHLKSLRKGKAVSIPCGLLYAVWRNFSELWCWYSQSEQSVVIEPVRKLSDWLIWGNVVGCLGLTVHDSAQKEKNVVNRTQLTKISSYQLNSIVSKCSILNSWSTLIGFHGKSN